jgi:hypothetical protein
MILLHKKAIFLISILILCMAGSCLWFLEIERDDDTFVFHEKHTLTPVLGSVNSISLVWAGTEWGVAWEESFNTDTDVYFLRFSGNGKIIGDKILLSETGLASHPQIIWNGNEYALAWECEVDSAYYISIAGINDGGLSFRTDIEKQPNLFSHPSIVWTGSHYTVAWSDNPDGTFKLYTATIDEDGTIDKEDDPVGGTDNTADHKRPSLVWNGTEYALAWQGYTEDGYKIYFLTFNDPVNHGKTPRCISNGTSTHDCQNPLLVRNGERYGVCWEKKVGESEYEVHFTSINGVENNFDVSVAVGLERSPHPSLSWNGNVYGVSWQHKEGDLYGIYIASINSNGTGKIREGACIEGELSPSLYSSSSIAWDGNDCGLVCSREEKFKSEIYFFY